MDKQLEDLFKTAYGAFNTRDIDLALTTMHQSVQWPRAFEGGYVIGHDEVRRYWMKQWTEINPRVDPIEFQERQNGTFEITVRQVVRDMNDNLMFDGIVRHIYTMQDGLLTRMDVELS